MGDGAEKSWPRQESLGKLSLMEKSMSRSDMNNTYIVFYDITSDKLRRKIEKKLCDYGMRVQYSVFSVFISEKAYRRLLSELSMIVRRHPALSESSDSIFSVKLHEDVVDSVWGDTFSGSQKYLMIG